MLLPGKGPDGASGTAGLQAVPGDLVQKPPLFLFSHGRKDAVGEGEINERIEGHMVGPGYLQLFSLRCTAEKDMLY